MKRYLITRNLDEFIIWEKKWWGWKCLKDKKGFVSFKTVEEAEKYVVKANMLHGLYPIVKEITFRN